MSIYHKEDPETIQAMFNSIARSYDRTNAILSIRMHHHWNQTLVDNVFCKGSCGEMLDLCCGTGEIAFTALQKSIRPSQVTLLDFSEEMLKCAKAKAASFPGSIRDSMTYLQADAQSIPLPNDSFDHATIAYGIRNVKNPSKCIREVFRILKYGGVFGILELTRPENSFLRFGHHLYLRTLLPLLGWCFSANTDAYQYLCRSINTFIEPKEMTDLLEQAGFRDIRRIRISGGIATILIAKKII